jgi:ABC-2 type transport system permease protein
MKDPDEARRLVDQDKTVSAVIIPAGFSQSIIPASGTNSAGPQKQIELVTNPSRPTSSGVIKSILDEFLSRVEIGRVGGQVVVTQLIQAGLVTPQDAALLGAQIGERQVAAAEDGSNITMKNVASGSEAVPFNVLAYMAPGMALMFLMYTVSNGGRTLLVERNLGTLPRLLVAPVSTAQVLGGKVFGIYLTGVAQMLILIGASTLLFRLNWGDMLGVLALVLAAVAGAVGWGVLITALAKTPGQVAGIGSGMMLTFGVLGGSFVSLGNFPVWFQWVSKITPNAWGLDGFSILASGGRLRDIVGPLTGLLVMGCLLFGAAIWVFNRRGFVQR